MDKIKPISKYTPKKKIFSEYFLPHPKFNNIILN